MCRIEVDLKPPVAKVEGSVNEFCHGVLHCQGHQHGDEDRCGYESIGDIVESTMLHLLPVHDKRISVK